MSINRTFPLPVTMAYSTANGTATDGQDYLGTTGSLTIAVTQTDDTGNITWKVARTDGLLDLGKVEGSIIAGLKSQAQVDAQVSCGGKWKAVTNGIDFQFASMTAVSTWKSPSDDIASIAPNLLKSNFKYGRQQWSNSPEKVISFSRRYSERHDKSGQAFEFEVENE